MDDAVEFDPAKVLSDRRFGTVSVRKTKNGLFWFTCIINGEGKRTTSYDLLSDAIRHVEKLRRRCRSHPHLDFTSNFESPFLTLANFKATRSLELRQKGDEDIDEAEADGTEEAEADGIEEAEACIEKKVEEQVQKLYYQTEHAKNEREKARKAGFPMFPFVPLVTFHFIIAFLSAVTVLLPDLDKLKTNEEKKIVSKVLIMVVMKLLSIYEKCKKDPLGKTSGDKASGDKASGDKASGKASGDKASGDKASEDQASEDQASEGETDPHAPNFFFQGCNLGLLFTGFPKIMSPLVDFLRSTSSFYLHDFLDHLYVVGFAEGDGCLTMLLAGTQGAVLDIAIGAQSKFYNYLVSIGFNGRKRHVRKSLNTKTIACTETAKERSSSVMIAAQYMSLKKLQVQHIVATAKDVCTNPNKIEFVTEYRKLNARMLSIINYNHGQRCHHDYFLDNILAASKFANSAFGHDDGFEHVTTLMILAGMMGADAVVGSGRNSRITRLCQSNLNYCRAFATAMHTLHNWKKPVSVYPPDKQASHDRNCSGNTRRIL